VFGKKAGSVINLKFVFYLLVWELNRKIWLVYPLLRQALGRYGALLVYHFIRTLSHVSGKFSSSIAKRIYH